MSKVETHTRGPHETAAVSSFIQFGDQMASEIEKGNWVMIGGALRRNKDLEDNHNWWFDIDSMDYHCDCQARWGYGPVGKCPLPSALREGGEG